MVLSEGLSLGCLFLAGLDFFSCSCFCPVLVLEKTGQCSPPASKVPCGAPWLGWSCCLL